MLLVVSIWTLYSFYELRNKKVTQFTDTYINTGIITGWVLISVSFGVMIILIMQYYKQ